jgi:hypothetical protein
VVGYGLDFNDEYRHLPFLAVLADDDPMEKDWPFPKQGNC